MGDILFKNLDLLDPRQDELLANRQVLVRGNTIVEVSEGVTDAGNAEIHDLGGRTLMPGLIDCHVHILPSILPVAPTMLPSLNTAYAFDAMKGMILRGFTTVRDAGGADAGHRKAVELDLVTGPRLFVCGLTVSQTGGHGDPRSPYELCPPNPNPHLVAGIGRIADGVSEVRRAVRDEIRLGADHIKIMASGGFGSIADPVGQMQYADDELAAAVDEARRSHTYVMAHVYPAEGIRRCLEAGVRTIEHGNLIDEATAAFMAQTGAYLVPTMICYHNTVERGHQLGYAEENISKAADILSAGTRSLELASAAGIPMAYGTDLPRAPDCQSDEFLIRAEVFTPAEIIRSATLIGAEVVRMEGRLGVIAPGAIADLLVVDGNPLEDIALLTGQGEHFPAIMKEGNFVKNELAA
jgi:imidazolonepropionase-like amidohydrolase